MGCRYKYAESSRISQDRETESHKIHILENGGSNPPPAINPSIVQRIKTIWLFFLWKREIQPRHCLTVIGGKYGEVAQLVEQ